MRAHLTETTARGRNTTERKPQREKEKEEEEEEVVGLMPRRCLPTRTLTYKHGCAACSTPYLRHMETR